MTIRDKIKSAWACFTNLFRGEKKWHTIVCILTVLAVICNLGIFVHIAIPFLPFIFHGAILAKASLFLQWFTYLSDPLIYIFKTLNRMTRYIGRRNGVEFIEEKFGVHEWQNKADLFTTFLFLIAIAAFFTPAAIFPLQAFVGWVVGIIGVSINLYFDEIHPAKKAKIKYYESDLSQANEIQERWKQHHYEALFYGCIIVSLILFLPCSSFANAYPLPRIADTVLNAIAFIGSGSIVLLNLLRFTNSVSCYISHKSVYSRFPGLLEVEQQKSKEPGSSEAAITRSLQNAPASQPTEPQPTALKETETKTERSTQTLPASSASSTPVSMLFLPQTSNQHPQSHANETNQRKLPCAIL